MPAEPVSNLTFWALNAPVSPLPRQLSDHSKVLEGRGTFQRQAQSNPYSADNKKSFTLCIIQYERALHFISRPSVHTSRSELNIRYEPGRAARREQLGW